MTTDEIMEMVICANDICTILESNISHKDYTTLNAKYHEIRAAIEQLQEYVPTQENSL